MTAQVPRVAFFSDSFHEVNGVALTSRELDGFARRRGYPFFSLHPGPATVQTRHNAATTMELKRGPLALGLETDMSFDLAFRRNRKRVLEALRAFRPDLVHITSPGDCGILGAMLAWDLRIPLVASWHTNLHQFAARRLDRLMRFLPDRPRSAIVAAAEEWSLMLTLRFYRLARVLLAPNSELSDLLERRTNRPCFLMRRGVDTELFRPNCRDRKDDEIVLGYVGRLNAEKSVRVLADVERALIDVGHTNYRFLIVGQGSEQKWLRTHLQRVELTGVLRGEALARAYANMDLFVFPSHTDTFGNVVQEALASAVPAVVTNSGGPKSIVQHGVNGMVARDETDFIRHVVRLAGNRDLRRGMQASARRYALSASWDAVFEGVYRSYEHALRMGRTWEPRPAGLLKTEPGHAVRT